MHRYIRLIISGILFLLILFPLSAQENDDEILIEADRPETPGRGEPGQTTVITGEELQTSGARNLTDFLQRVPGVKVNRQGSVLETATISIRGSSADQVLVLVDGKARNGLWGSAVNINSIPLDKIETIEIIRGGGSALYGEGALSGVVSITTKKGEVWNPDLSVKGALGSFKTISGGFSLSGALDNSGYISGVLNCEALSTGGTYSYDSGQGEESRDNNKGYSGSVSGGLSWNPVGDETVSIDLSGEGQITERGIPGLMEFLTPEAKKTETLWSMSLSVTLQDIIPGKGKLILGGGSQFSEFTNPADNLDESHDNLSGTVKLDWESPEAGTAATISGLLGIEGGIDQLDSTGLTDSTGTALNGTAQQISGSAWGSLQMAYRWASLTPALRFDSFQQEYIDNKAVKRSAFSWSVTSEAALERLTIEWSVQSSYHNPTFQDLFWPSGAFASGNPDLLPEKGIGTDLGITWDITERLTLNSAAYYQQVTDLIQWLPSAGGIWRPQNVGIVNVYGTELSLKGIEPLEQKENSGVPWVFEYMASYDWLRCINITSDSINYGNQLAYRPEHSGALSLILTAPGGSSLEITGTIQGLRFSNNANTKYFDPLFLLEASWRFFITPSWEISTTGRNLTNQSYIDSLGYPVPGIEWTIEGGFHY